MPRRSLYWLLRQPISWHVAGQRLSSPDRPGGGRMTSKSHGALGVAARTVVAVFLAGCAGLTSAADYCCKCKGQSVGKTISGASGPLEAATQCGRDCGSLTAPSPGKCAEPAPAAAPASAAPAPRAV